LTRLRVANCTQDDYNLLQTHLIHIVKPDWSREWCNAPIIVSNNDVKDAFNIQAAPSFARQKNCPLHWYHCINSQGGREIMDKKLQEYLAEMHVGSMNQQLAKIPLIIGMPVIIAHNFDVEGGIVNGCQGILEKICYTIDSQGNQHAVSCVVHASSTSDNNLPHLPPNYVVTLQDSIDLDFCHPYSQKCCKIMCHQIPIFPAFAMMTHKAQGKTLSQAVVDIESCKGTEAPYVMLSCVTSLSSLLIL
jgi:hypothetical protein